MLKTQAADPFLAAWEATLARRAAKAAVFDTGGAVVRTFAQIEEEACRLLEEKLSNLSAHSVVGIQLGNDPAWPAWLLACMRKRLVALPMEGSISEAERDAALKVCHASLHVTPTGINPLSAAPVDWQDSPPVLLKLTSGTTAAPRAIRFRSEQLVADCEQICDSMEITDRDVNFGVIPLSHSYGFSNVLTPLLLRGVSAVLSRDRMPRALLDDLARTGASVFPGMPVFYQALCAMDEIPVLPRLRLCISAGAPLPLALAQKFREKFGQPIHSFYGSSECGGICYDRAAALEQDGFVGPPLVRVKMEALEPGTESSRYQVHSAAAGDGYFPEPDEEKLRPGCFVPDDLLAQSSEGFRIVGRLSDVINVAGKKVNPAEVEATLLAFEGVRQAVVFGKISSLRNEEVAACIVADPQVEEGALLEFCRGRLSGWQVPKRLFFLEDMPVSERGKISRRALAEKFRS